MNAGIFSRRGLLSTLTSGLATLPWLRSARADEHATGTPLVTAATHGSYLPVNTLGIPTLPFRMDGNVKVFELVAEPVTVQFPDMSDGMGMNPRPIDTWGYSGSMIGPTIEVVEGDTVRILVTNRLSEATTVHWHGLTVPNAMDGVAFVTQDPIQPGQTYTYEFTLQQSGTYFYHPHFMSAKQVGMGMCGFFIVHPKTADPSLIVDQDFAVMLQIWKINPASPIPDTLEMSAFNYFTMNGYAGPNVPPMNVSLGQRVRIRVGNMSMLAHPVHLHGHTFRITEMGAGFLPDHQQMRANTINVSGAEVRTLEFEANYPGKWMFHCHFLHHTMNDMDRPPLPGPQPPMSASMNHDLGGMQTMLVVT
jgi:FtsP/CotA-like multicopper oxidase with cupredoxin domain